VVELDYVQRMLASLLWLPTEALGAGPAVQLGPGRRRHHALHAGAEDATTVVEINPQVVDANRSWFHLPADRG
jgi:spermidine synthase